VDVFFYQQRGGSVTLGLLKDAQALGVQVVQAVDHVVDLIEVQTVEKNVLIYGRLSGEDVDHRPILVLVVFPCAVPNRSHKAILAWPWNVYIKFV
jgi:hypothetical protein